MRRHECSVFIYCYDLSDDEELLKFPLKQLNAAHASFTNRPKIIPHTAVRVHGFKYEFGRTGPTRVPYNEDSEAPHVEEWEMGTVTLTLEQVDSLVASMNRDLGFLAERYHPLNKNCLDYSSALLSRLLNRSVPLTIWSFFSRFHSSTLIQSLENRLPETCLKAASVTSSAVSIRTSECCLRAIPVATPITTFNCCGHSIYFVITFNNRFILRMKSPLTGDHTLIHMPLQELVITLYTICQSCGTLKLFLMGVSNFLSDKVFENPHTIEWIVSGKKVSIRIHRRQISIVHDGQRIGQATVGQILKIVTLFQGLNGLAIDCKNNHNNGQQSTGIFSQLIRQLLGLF